MLERLCVLRIAVHIIAVRLQIYVWMLEQLCVLQIAVHIIAPTCMYMSDSRVLLIATLSDVDRYCYHMYSYHMYSYHVYSYHV